MTNISFSNQLRWVILLLATAVILPTVCLLWFMNQAIKNEQLAVRSKLVDVYQKQYKISLEKCFSDDYLQVIISMPAAEGILIYGPNKKLTFPVMSDDIAPDNSIFESAITFEHQEKRYNLALEEYQHIAEITHDPQIRIQAQISQARCLSKLQQIDKAVEMLRTALQTNDLNVTLRTQKCRAFLLLLEMSAAAGGEDFENTLGQAYDFLTWNMRTDNDLQFLGESDYLMHSIVSGVQAYALNQFADYAAQLAPKPDLENKINRARKLASIITASLELAQDYPEPWFIDSPDIVSSAVFSFKTQKPYYGRYRWARGYIRTLVFSREYLAATMNPLLKDISQMPANCAIYDNTGQWVAGITPRTEQQPFIKMPLSDWLPGWSAHLYVQDTTFNDFANRQVIIYIWGGFLVIGFILLSGTIATTVIVKQQKMNRLKNDFIATVTHELKTPLSSMRLLVDTLLEKRYENEKTATEYLQMVANENKRLTHLIDSFLTFSRMERNKQVFDFQSISPGEITIAAVEAMQTKLSGSNCHFSYSVSENLPFVSTDKNAMITVLVNLLDNAYKYTNSNKQIELNVYQQDGYVCFAVRDNGIGLSARARRKIFNRFYQVDSRLSRRSEGCGLGLSIVKFIVDANRGIIEVESKLDQGSIFTVKLPEIS